MQTKARSLAANAGSISHAAGNLLHAPPDFEVMPPDKHRPELLQDKAVTTLSSLIRPNY
ncbi:MAG: hypothetical protein ACD_39C01951G0003 [uncultured bacterium]|nr:MAG: hypothetical protein ACD_39C01951G0003 [uncultured bacterium]